MTAFCFGRQAKQNNRHYESHELFELVEDYLTKNDMTSHPLYTKIRKELEGLMELVELARRKQKIV